MRRWIAVAAIGGAALAGCVSSEADRRSAPGSTSSTEPAGPRTISGTVVFADAWTFDPGEFPRTVRNGEMCRAAGEARGDGDDLGPHLVVVADGDEKIGGVRLGVGEISGLGSAGFDLPSQLETVLIASESLVRRATCSYTFSLDPAARSRRYSFAIDGEAGIGYTEDALDALDWVVELKRT